MSDPRPCESCGGPMASPEGGNSFCPTCLLREGLAGAETGPADAETQADDGVEEPTGVASGADPETIGPYRIIRRLGEGGMGVVYLADQTGSLRRQVAIKLIKSGVASSQVVARFQMEQQSLALMSHSGIAKIFDAGTSDAGLPYFVMEYVDGSTITKYCDERRLTNRARIELFIQVCAAVQHAHQRGVIHRDLKPSNILVTETDAGPQARVIDFGVAKMTAKRYLEWSVNTEVGRLVGTPVYMSPEQAGEADEAVDTRTDVYSLGIVLYELLVGTTPLDEDSLRGVGLNAILEAIRNATIPTPSSRADALSKAGEDAASRRSSPLNSISRQLRGELDWIVMRALEREKGRRFRSPADLADDLQLYLANEPVRSGPPSAIYRLRKKISRHRVAFTLAAMAFTGLVVAVTGISVGFVRAQRAEADARQQAEIAQATNQFLNEDLLEAVAPEGSGRDAKLVDLLDRAGKMVDQRFPNAPLTRAAIHRTIGRANLSLGRFPPAEPHLNAALELRSSILGTNDIGTAESMSDLAALYASTDRVDQGLEMVLASQKLIERLPNSTAEMRLRTQREVAQITQWTGDRDRSVELLESALVQARAELGNDNEETILILNDLAQGYGNRNELDRAIPMNEEAITLHSALLGEQHAHTLVMKANLAGMHIRKKEYEIASEMLAALGPQFHEVYGVDHPRTLTLLSNEARALAGSGRHGEAAELHRELIGRRSALFGPLHRDTLSSHYSYARTKLILDDVESAVEHFRIAYAGRLELFGDQNSQTVYTESLLAAAEGRLGLFDSALSHHESAISRRGVLPASQQHIVAALYYRYGSTLAEAGRPIAAIAALVESERLLEPLGDIRAADRSKVTARREEVEMALK